MDRKGIAGIVACGALLVLWFFFYQLPTARRRADYEAERRRLAQEQAQPGDEAPADPPNRPSDPPPPEIGPEAGDGDPARPPIATPPPRQPPQDPGTEAQGELVELSDGNGLRVILDTAAGGIVRCELLNFRDAEGTGNVVLGGARVPFLGLVGADGARLRASAARVTETTENSLTLERDLTGLPLQLRETWSLLPDRAYEVQYQAVVTNTGDAPFDLTSVALGCGTLAPETDSKGMRVGRVGMIDLTFDAKAPGQNRFDSFSIKDVRGFDSQARAQLADGPRNWAALHNKYFVFLLEAEGREGEPSFSGLGMVTGKGNPKKDPVPLSAWATPVRAVVDPGEEAVLSFRGYLGPKELDRLEAMGDGLNRIMRLDYFFFLHPRWMGWISRLILKSLVGINAVVDGENGYGVAIILITFVIKMLFWPLTHHSTRSMKRMQELKPQLDELRAKYKEQPQKIQQKTMELYRQNGVNPASGCLPILLQMPVFFSLFNTLRSSLALRQARFLWVQDLSLPDTVYTITVGSGGFPIRPLAAFMGATMVFQQLTTPSAADPQQKRMMTFMTLFFLVIFYNMPSGLTLYWSVNQVLTIIQNLISRRLEKRAAAAG